MRLLTILLQCYLISFLRLAFWTHTSDALPLVLLSHANTRIAHCPIPQPNRHERGFENHLTRLSPGNRDLIRTRSRNQQQQQQQQQGQQQEQQTYQPSIVLDRALAIYTHGLWPSAYQFIRAITVGLPALLPVTGLDYHASIDYFATRGSRRPQPGGRVLLWADDRVDRERRMIHVDLRFGCQGHQYSEWMANNGNLIIDKDNYHQGNGHDNNDNAPPCLTNNNMRKPLDLSYYCQAADHAANACALCVPHVTIEEVTVNSKLQGRGFTTRLLLNLLNTMELIHRQSSLSQSHSSEQQQQQSPPKLSTVAYSSPLEGYFGASYWADRGFQFVDDDERKRLITRFIDWLKWEADVWPIEGKWIDLVSHLEQIIKTPVDLLQLDLTGWIVGGRTWNGGVGKIGRLFFSLADTILWKGELLVDWQDTKYQQLKQRLLHLN